MNFCSELCTAFLTVPVKKLCTRLMMNPQNPDPLSVTVPTVTVGEPETAVRTTPPCSDRRKSTVALMKLAVTWILEPPMQHVVPHALTLSRTFGRLTVARRPPGISDSDVDG